MDIDRAIGTLASLSLALGLYRFVSEMAKGKISDSRAWTLVRVLFGAALTKKLKSISFSGNCDSNRHESENEKSCEYVVLGGSCHCNSISFKVSRHRHIVLL